jgi:hypothetical protein
MRALTLIRPYCFAIAKGWKAYENRGWPPFAGVLGTRIAIHSGQKYSDAGYEAIESIVGSAAGCGESDCLPGQIIATVLVHGCVRHDGRGGIIFHEGLTLDEACAVLASPWVSDLEGCAWVLRDPIMLPKPVPCRGAQGLWTLKPEIEALVNEQIARAA